MVTEGSTDPGPSMQSSISLTSTTSLLTTVPFQPLPREDEAPVSESTPQIVSNDAKMLNNQANFADVEVKDLNSRQSLEP